MKFSTKRLSATIALALLAAGSASAGNLCGMGLPGMGCGQTSGMTDSTQHGWVGAQSSTSWSPPQQTDSLATAMAAFQAKTTMLAYYAQFNPALSSPAQYSYVPPSLVQTNQMASQVTYAPGAKWGGYYAVSQQSYAYCAGGWGGCQNQGVATATLFFNPTTNSYYVG